MKLYKFTKQGKLINSIMSDSQEDAEVRCGITIADYDSVETEAVNENQQPIKENKRKTRSDKGQSRKTEPKKTPKSRRKPEYFIIYPSQTVYNLTRDNAIKELGEHPDIEARIIMGHEITFTRKVSFHLR